MRASRSRATSSSGPRARRSRSAFSSATWPASRSASSPRRCSSPGCHAGDCDRRPAGAPSQAQARAPASASPSRCSSPRWPSTVHSSRRPRPASSPPPSLAPDGAQPEEAKAGTLAAPVGAAAVTWLVFRIIGLLSHRRRIAALLGGAEALLDLEFAVDPERDHIRGPVDAPVTVVEYGDFECPYCGRAEAAVRELLRDFADVRYVWRHLPLADVHPHAELAALASEAAADQGAFWNMHDELLEHQDRLRMADLVSYADRLGLDVARFTEALQAHVGANRIAQDVEGADLSRVSGTPTFFINGRRHHGAYDIDHLSRAVSAAGAPAMLEAS